jgi:hypothetical protein
LGASWFEVSLGKKKLASYWLTRKLGVVDVPLIPVTQEAQGRRISI